MEVYHNLWRKFPTLISNYHIISVFLSVHTDESETERDSISDTQNLARGFPLFALLSLPAPSSPP